MRMRFGLLAVCAAIYPSLLVVASEIEAQSPSVTVRFLGAIAFVPTTASPYPVWAMMLNGADKRLLPDHLAKLEHLELHVGAIRVKKEFIHPDSHYTADLVELLRGRDIVLDGTLTTPIDSAALVSGRLFEMEDDNPSHKKVCTQCSQLRPTIPSAVLSGRMLVASGTFHAQCLMKHKISGKFVEWELKGKVRKPVAQEVYVASNFTGDLRLRLIDPASGKESLNIKLQPQTGRVKIDVVSVPLADIGDFDGACGPHLDNPGLKDVEGAVETDMGDPLDHFAWFYLLSENYNPSEAKSDLVVPTVASKGEKGGHPYCTHAVFVQ